MRKHKTFAKNLISPFTLTISMALFGVIFHDWEGFKAGLFGTYEPGLVVDYSSIISDSLLVSLPIAFALYFGKKDRVNEQSST